MSPRIRRPASVWLIALFTLALAAAPPAEASHFRGARIHWCWSPPPDSELTSHYFSFFIEVTYRNFAGLALGDTVTETFNLGDGSSEPVVLTVVEVHPGGPGEEGWVLARGEILHHLYPGGDSYVSARLESCCRINGVGGPELNNRNDGNFIASSLVYIDADELCSPRTGFPAVIWLAGDIGDTFTIPLPVPPGVFHDGVLHPILCRFATDAEAGGGPNPDGMTIDPETCTITWTPTGGDPDKLWTTQVQAEQYYPSGDQITGTTPIDFLLGLDAARPACRLLATEPGPPTRIRVFAQDVRSGIAQVQVLESTNATVQVPPFSPGTTEALTVIGTKLDQALSSRVRLRVTDLAGNATECDPILTEVARDTGRPRSDIYTGIAPEERFVTVLNGDPGLRNLHVEVNGQRFSMADLKAGEERTIDVGAAVREGEESTVVLTPRGKPGDGAVVLIWDGQ